MKIFIAGAVFLLAIAMPAIGQSVLDPSGGARSTKPDNANCGLLYGKDHSLTFCAPDGWVLDTSIMNDQGIYAVFYPDHSSWEEARNTRTIMYINVIGRPAHTTVEKMMAGDADEAKQSEPATVIKQADPIKIADSSTPVLRFAPGAFNRFEAVAYVGEEKVLVMFVISSKNEEIFTKDYPAFVKLVQSYKFLSSNVTFQNK